MVWDICLIFCQLICGHVPSSAKPLCTDFVTSFFLPSETRGHHNIWFWLLLLNMWLNKKKERRISTGFSYWIHRHMSRGSNKLNKMPFDFQFVGSLQFQLRWQLESKVLLEAFSEIYDYGHPTELSYIFCYLSTNLVVSFISVRNKLLGC